MDGLDRRHSGTCRRRLERRLPAQPRNDCMRPPIGPDDLMLFELAAAQGLAAEPVGRRRSAHGTDDAGDLVAGMEERQQVGIELEAVATVDYAFDGEKARRPMLADRGQMPLEHEEVLLSPALEEILAAQLRAEQLAQPRAGEPVLIRPRIDPLEHERLRQDAGDARGLDLQAKGREAPCPHLVPVVVKGLKGSLHDVDGNPVLPLAAQGSAPPKLVPAAGPCRNETPAGRCWGRWSTIHAPERAGARPALDPRQPIFNVPGVVLGLLVSFVAVHLVRWALPEEEGAWLTAVLAF